MLGASLHARSPVFWRPSTDMPALPSITHLVIEGDSITADNPGAAEGKYSHRYDDHRPDKTVHVRAQGSREVGQAANLNDDGNTLMGKVAEDVGYGPQLVTAMIGANDLPAARTAAQHRADLAGYHAALKAASPAVRFAWSPPLPYNPTGAPHSSYDTFTSRRATLMTDARDPAVWSRWADVYLPLGEHPDFADAATAAPLFSDTVHPSAAGQALLFEVYKAAVDSILDASRAHATRMYDAAWPTGEDGLVTSATVTLRFIVAGLKHTGLALIGANALAVAGGGGVQIRRAGDAWGTSVAGWLYNGDVVDLRLTASASASTDTVISLQVGAETRSLAFRTGAAAMPVSVVDGGYASVTNTSATTTTFAARPFDSGLAIVAIDTNGAMATAVTIGGGTMSKLREDGFMQLWAGPVAAGEHDIVVTQGGGYKPRLAVLWLTVRNADPTPVAAGATSAADVPPHAAPALTRPANGLVLGFINYIGLSTAPAIGIAAGDTDSELIRAGAATWNGDVTAIAAAKRAASGSVAFTSSSGYGGPWRTALVLKAAGT